MDLLGFFLLLPALTAARPTNEPIIGITAGNNIKGVTDHLYNTNQRSQSPLSSNTGITPTLYTFTGGNIKANEPIIGITSGNKIEGVNDHLYNTNQGSQSPSSSNTGIIPNLYTFTGGNRKDNEPIIGITYGNKIEGVNDHLYNTNQNTVNQKNQSPVSNTGNSATINAVAMGITDDTPSTAIDPVAILNSNVPYFYGGIVAPSPPGFGGPVAPAAFLAGQTPLSLSPNLNLQNFYIGSNTGFTYTGGPNSRSEIRDANGRVRGIFSYVDAFGRVQTRHYIADSNGFRILSGTDIP